MREGKRGGEASGETRWTNLVALAAAVAVPVIWAAAGDAALALASAGGGALVLIGLPRFAVWVRQWTGWWGAERDRRWLLFVALSMALLALTATRTSRLELRYQAAHSGSGRPVETIYLPPPAVLKAAGLGHQAFVHDMIFLQANAYFVDHLFGDRIFDWLDAYFESLVALDPDNREVYEWATQVVKYGQFISHDVLERSNDYARRGIERFPDHWRFYFDIGFNYLIEWNPDSEEQRREVRDKAMPYIAVAAALPDSELDPNFVATLYLEKNDVEMALFHLYLRYWEADERERDEIRKRILQFGSQASAERLSRLEERWRAELPYVDLGVFEVMGPGAAETGVVPRSWAEEGGG